MLSVKSGWPAGWPFFVFVFVFSIEQNDVVLHGEKIRLTALSFCLSRFWSLLLFFFTLGLPLSQSQSQSLFRVHTQSSLLSLPHVAPARPPLSVHSSSSSVLSLLLLHSPGIFGSDWMWFSGILKLNVQFSSSIFYLSSNGDY